jgi:hypothetical protein
MARLLTITITLALSFGPQPCVASETPTKDEQLKVEAKRKELWAALKTALPKEIKAIDAYCENPSLTQVFFSARGDVYLFSLKDEMVRKQTFMKVLPRINRIEFQVNKEGSGAWLLWCNGSLEMTVAGDT